MYPIIPHLVSECLKQINETSFPNWPEINNKYLQNKSFNIVVQINGKKRGILNFKKEIQVEDLINEIIKNNELKKWETSSNLLLKNKTEGHSNKMYDLFQRGIHVSYAPLLEKALKKPERASRAIPM